MATQPAPTPHTATSSLRVLSGRVAGLRAELAVGLRGAGREDALVTAEAVEDLARAVGVLQLLAARAVQDSAPDAPTPSETLGLVAVDDAHGESEAATGPGREGNGSTDGTGSSDSAGGQGTDGGGAGECAPGRVGPVESGSPYRRARDLLRMRLRISGREAARRLRLADQVCPRATLTGQELPARREHLNRVAPQVDAEATGQVLRTLERLEAVTEAGILDEVERDLSGYALTFDPDQLRRICQHTIAVLDPDGAEPSLSVAAARQGVHIGTTRNGLTQLRLVVDAIQLEILSTIFGTATNPRRTSATAPSAAAGAGTAGVMTTDVRAVDGADPDASTGAQGPTPTGEVTGAGALGEESVGPSGSEAGGAEGGGAGSGESSLLCAPGDPRTRAQRMLDALIAASQCALRALGATSHTGGVPTQVMVTIDAADLIGNLTAPSTGRALSDTTPTDATRTDTSTSGPGWLAGTGTGTGTGVAYLPHGGPVPVRQVRRMACDADIIPILLGSTGRVLDLGQSRRLVPAWMRTALIARDHGCTFPGCTIPATWCEAHHVTPWHKGGATSTDNLLLLCPYHHHLVDADRWTIARPHPDAPPTFTPGWRAPRERVTWRSATAPGLNRYHTGQPPARPPVRPGVL